MKSVIMHSAIASQMESVQSGLAGDLPISLGGMKIIYNDTLTKPANCKKKQDRRKNSRIQARRRMRQSRAPRVPDDTVYVIDTNAMDRQFKNSMRMTF
jgi:hypothetical protein